MRIMKTYTIGFTQKKAEDFFSLLKSSGVKTLVDVRLNNTSQLSGFAKKDDLEFFLEALCNVDYVHMPDLSPTREMLSSYRKGLMPWDEYEDRFLDLMARRNAERAIAPALLDHGCLLCSEHKPHYCHRRLVVDYLNETGGFQLQVKHLF